jgi:hypothetical protein
MSDSALGQQQINSALLPVVGAEAGVAQGAQTAEIGDLNTLAQNIASLQSGANAGALSAAGGFSESQNALQAAIQSSQIGANKQFPLTTGQAVYNPATGQTGAAYTGGLNLGGNSVASSPSISNAGNVPKNTITNNTTTKQPIAAPSFNPALMTLGNNNNGGNNSSQMKLNSGNGGLFNGIGSSVSNALNWFLGGLANV